MTSKINKGDKLVVLNGVSSLRMGELVTAASDSSGGTGSMVSVIRDSDSAHYPGCYSYRFGPAPAAKVVIDLTKPLETVGGRSFTLLTSAGRSSFPVVGYLDDANGRLSEYTTEGACASGHPVMNLRNVAVKPMTTELVIYKNLYIEDGKLVAYGYHKTREQANNNAGSGRVGVNKVVTTLTEGQFDA